MYYIVHEDCYFESDELLNLYKSILFKEGEAYAPQIAKETQEGCENIEYAGVAAEISQSSFLEALDKLTV